LPIQNKGLFEILKALCHPTRFLIVEELIKGKKCVSKIQDLIKASQPNISQHLSILRLTGIVEWEQNGQTKCYCLKNPDAMKKLFNALKGFG
jgi:DNA-binding transcriptional ArsR family regulator